MKMNRDMNTELILAKEKAEAIIKSCVTCDHFETVIPYIELFYKQFNDVEEYNYLMELYNNKLQELHCNG